MSILFIVIIIGLLAAYFISKNVKLDKHMREITVREAFDLIKNYSYRVIDVRESEEYEMGHIEGSLNMPLSTLKQTFRQISGNENIIIVCGSGNRSMNALSFLKDQGYDNIINMKGGIAEWAKSGLPINS